jgi:cob(I)alamin adenosyltransferase
MVYLSRIYTKSGDGGDTGLGNGERVAKDHPRVAAYGEVDELNSVLGLLLASCPNLDPAIAIIVREIQNDLFDVGADLCVPLIAEGTPTQALRVRPDQAVRLEGLIDRYNEPLQPLRSFILPGGTPAAAWCHMARTVCRRAERGVVALMHREPINPEALIYLNRLSDLLFVLGRTLNDQGRSDVLWVPGGERPDRGP